MCGHWHALSIHVHAGLSLRALTRNTCYGRVHSILRVRMLIGVKCMLHLRIERNATGDNFNVAAA